MTKEYLTRSEAADYLTGKGVPTSKNTLQKFATVGGGPVYRRFGNRALYIRPDLDTYVVEKISEPMRAHGIPA